MLQGNYVKTAGTSTAAATLSALFAGSDLGPAHASDSGITPNPRIHAEPGGR